MPLLFGIIVLVALSILSLALFSLWGIPVVVLTVIAIVTYIASARRKDPTVGTFERAATPEPTGVPRSSSGGAQTTNERVGA